MAQLKRLMRLIIAWVLTILSWGLNDIAYAHHTLGHVAANLTSMTSSFAHLVYKICYVIAVAMLVGSVIQYHEHRNHPRQVKLDRPITLLIIGVSVGLLPWIGQLSEASKALN